MKLSGSINNTGQILYKMMQGRIKRIMKRMMKRIIKAPVKKKILKRKTILQRKNISRADRYRTKIGQNRTASGCKDRKADKTEQIYQQEADERKAQKRVREAVQKENSEAAGKAHESYVIQPGDTLFR